MNFLKKFEQKMNRFAIGGIINYVCAMLAMGTVLYLVAPGFLNYLILNPIAIMHGQVWRILTFLYIRLHLQEETPWATSCLTPLPSTASVPLA